MATNEQDAYQKTRSNRMSNLFLANRICQIIVNKTSSFEIFVVYAIWSNSNTLHIFPEIQ